MFPLGIKEEVGQSDEAEICFSLVVSELVLGQQKTLEIKINILVY